MKKMIFSLLAIAATMNVFAIDYTAKATLTLTDTNTGNKLCPSVTLAQSDDATIGMYSAVMNMDYVTAAFYVYDATADKKYQIYAANDLGTMTFGLMTNAVTDYTLTATNVIGTLYIYDAVADKYFELKDGATYDFTATANETNVTRFALSAAPVAADPTICHYYNKLEVRNSNGMTVQVLNLDGSATSVADTDITTDSKVEIDLSGLAAGQYLVKWNGKDLIIQQ